MARSPELAAIIARFELERLDSRDIVEAELTRERYRELDLKVGEEVFMKPRTIRVFAPDSQI